MDFRLSEDQQLIRQTVREFAEGEIRPGVAKRDLAHEFPVDLMPKLQELGLLGMCIPESLGGAGMDEVTAQIATEELARVCPSTAVTVSVTNGVCAGPIQRWGSDALKKRYLARLAAGELGGFCLTEPDAGSDAAALRTRAERRDGKWILNGTKAWITNVEVGTIFVVMAVTDPAATKSKRISAFVVESSFPGFRFDRLEEKMGLHASRTGGVIFENCEVPEENLLGNVGDGLKIALGTLDGSRIGIAAQAVGIAQAAYEESVRYALQRKTFGKPIAQHQAIQCMLADMATEIDAARWMVYRTAWEHDQKRDHGRNSSITKLFATEMAGRVCDKALQIHGGYGYSHEYAVERLYRDVRVTRIYEGTSEIQRMVIARSILG